LSENEILITLPRTRSRDGRNSVTSTSADYGFKPCVTGARTLPQTEEGEVEVQKNKEKEVGEWKLFCLFLLFYPQKRKRARRGLTSPAHPPSFSESHPFLVPVSTPG
jgi:hypothetical protein